jgi:hypothetical protein
MRGEMIRSCMRCGQEVAYNMPTPPCAQGGRHSFTGNAHHDTAGRYIKRVQFTRTSVMEVPCSWMPGGYMKIGGKPLSQRGLP